MNFLISIAVGAVMSLVVALVALAFGGDASHAGLVGVAAGGTAAPLILALLTQQAQHKRDLESLHK